VCVCVCVCVCMYVCTYACVYAHNITVTERRRSATFRMKLIFL
jgi:hypothetical protein